MFPNSFSELEKLKRGGFYIYDNGIIKYEPLQIVNVYSIEKECSHMTPEEIQADIKKEIENQSFNNTIVTIKLHGILHSGKPTDINMKEIVSMLYAKSAFFVMKNTNKLESKEFEEIKVQENTVNEVEESLIKEHLGQSKELGIDIQKESELTKQLIELLSVEKQEGEKVYEFEERVRRDTKKVIEQI